MQKVKLECPLEDFEQIHRDVDNKKKTVRVNGDQLRKLLCDHSAMISALNDAGITIVDNQQVLESTKVSTVKQSKGKLWKVIDPSGNEQIVDNLTAFCKENGLTGSVMSGVANGKYSHHKQWKCEKLD